MSAKPKTTLLIVDDDAPIRKLLEHVAVRAGFEADCAKDGIEALEMLERKNYAIAIIDLMMPRLSGYELVHKISEFKPRPVIIVATALTNADVSKIDDTLVRGVIRKPFDIEAVARVLIDIARSMADQQDGTQPVVEVTAKQISDEIAKKGETKDDTPPKPPDVN
ncbi:MAG TPA: response regulator [Thermoanaerobaculia bacterium]